MLQKNTSVKSNNMANYVTFEQAEWLKEKEFNQKCKNAFIVSEFEEVGPYDEDGLEINWNKHKSEIDPKRKFISRPDQHQLNEWLTVNHGIWVEVTPTMNMITNTWREYYKGSFSFMFTITYSTEELFLKHINQSRFHQKAGYKTPQEAYSAAFDYIINNNLI